MKPERPSNLLFLFLFLLAIVFGIFVVGRFANHFLKQTPDFNDEIREPSPEEID
jgi:Na+-transporting methylmalonyl-CoA/oxaloacetate decarboxylase gamma subunit